ncbi:hypothetical protein [Methylosinus sp. LW4]|uniref:hypothetical protein n=1 Tax=Methylosinus sp. LW4 TaxID=136993 RepID=UPI00039DB0F4|nr:hypothetical protein [Methylosinus sp. LW4]
MTGLIALRRQAARSLQGPLLISFLASSAACCFVNQVSAAGSASQSLGGAEQDFRQRLFYSKRDMEKEGLTPLVDRAFLLGRLHQLLVPVEPAQPIGRFKKLLRPTRALSYHVVLRYEASDESKGFVDGHIPDVDVSKKPPAEAVIYQDSISTVVSEIAKLGALKPENDASRADLLIYVNLAERAQTSEAFNYETMSRLPQRVAGRESPGDLQMMEYVLPWTFVRLYYRDTQKQSVEAESKRSIEGGEIWVQYPRRTYWQAEIAQVALDKPDIGARLGLGATREAVVSRFRTPHKSALEPIKEALSHLRQIPQIGAGGLPSEPGEPAARPKESLLSLATGSRQHADGAQYLVWPGPPDALCGASTHSRLLAKRIGRSMAMFVGAIEAGALRVGPLGDYTSEFKNDPEGLLSDFSLAGYRGSFDQRLNDDLTLLSVEELRVAHGDRPLQDATTVPRDMSADIKDLHHLADSKLALRVIDRRADDIRLRIREIALGFTPDGGGCAHFRDLERGID